MRIKIDEDNIRKANRSLTRRRKNEATMRRRRGIITTVPPLVFDDENVEAWSKNAKVALRQKLRAVRQALPESANLARSRRIVERLLLHPRIQCASSVALFWPILQNREIDLRSLDERLRAQQVSLYYPFMARNEDGSHSTGFRRSGRADELLVRQNRFAEPPPTEPLAQRGDIDVVIVPALAATPEGDRLGYGAGFYDATLPDICPPAFSIVVVYDFQMLFELPRQGHDFLCDEVLTDR